MSLPKGAFDFEVKDERSQMESVREELRKLPRNDRTIIIDKIISLLFDPLMRNVKARLSSTSKKQKRNKMIDESFFKGQRSFLVTTEREIETLKKEFIEALKYIF